MLTIRIENISVTYWLWKWSENDFKKPISFAIENARVEFKFIKVGSMEKDRQVAMNGEVRIFLDSPSQQLLKGLSTIDGTYTQEAATYIHKIAEECVRRLGIYSRWALGLNWIISEISGIEIEDLFGEQTFGIPNVTWTLDGKEYKEFKPRLRKKRSRINPMFKSKNLLTPSKWQELQRFISRNPLPSNEIVELLRIRTRAAWHEKRVSTLETVALIEVVIRHKIQRIAMEKGISKKKIENIEDDVTLSVLLNLLLPMFLNKYENQKYWKYINDLDNLRKLRNQIMHKNIPEEKLDTEKVYRGVVAAIKIVSFLERKFPD
ncbi:MAG TPA: hypothetical protein VMT04_10185 [Terriglobales bacterium]|nr:hypothetical protein [Terriglobales bacterium]